MCVVPVVTFVYPESGRLEITECPHQTLLLTGGDATETSEMLQVCFVEQKMGRTQVS